MYRRFGLQGPLMVIDGNTISGRKIGAQLGTLWCKDGGATLRLFGRTKREHE